MSGTTWIVIIGVVLLIVIGIWAYSGSGDGGDVVIEPAAEAPAEAPVEAPEEAPAAN